MARLPTADEQLSLELINRFRMNPAAEADLIAGPNMPADVFSAVHYFGVSLNAFHSQLAISTPAAPLAWNGLLADAAYGHNHAMIAADEQSHQTPGEASLGPRATAAGYTWNALGENVFAFAKNTVYSHAGFVIDWGYDAEDYSGGQLLSDWKTRGDGMQDPAGHRISMLNATYKEVGISMVAETSAATDVGPYLITQDFGSSPTYKAQFVGVVIDDADKDGFYDVGEGQAGVTLIFTRQSDGTKYQTTSWASGGFQLVAPAGAYSVTVSGGDLAAPLALSATIGSANVHLTLVENATSGGSGGAATPPTSASVIETLTFRAGDFNGDGRDDVTWRNDNGALTNWLGQTNGSFIANDAKAMTSVPTSWHVAGIGDFNGDGRSDLAWRSDGGAFSSWLGAANGGFTSNDAKAMTSVPASWHVVGTGDFNGDGRDDVLWRNDNGALTNWLGQADGSFASNDAKAMTSAPTSWRVVGTGDFNGDGRDDVLWRNDSGTFSDWLGQANGGFIINDAKAMAPVPTIWHVAGTGDFNGDGRDDVLWRSDGGGFSDWLGQADGSFVSNDAKALTSVPISWHVAGTGDFNGDGRDDVLWRSDSGGFSDWLGQADGGFAGNDAKAWADISNSWHVAAPASFA